MRPWGRPARRSSTTSRRWPSTRETGNRDDEAIDLSGLAGCYATLGQTGAAIEHYQQALAISRETGNRSSSPAA